MEYIIVSAWDKSDLEIKVNEKLIEGYELRGELVLSRVEFYQVMIKK